MADVLKDLADLRADLGWQDEQEAPEGEVHSGVHSEDHSGDRCAAASHFRVVFGEVPGGAVQSRAWDEADLDADDEREYQQLLQEQRRRDAAELRRQQAAEQRRQERQAAAAATAGDGDDDAAAAHGSR